MTKRPHDFVFKFPNLAQHAPDRSTRNVLEESAHSQYQFEPTDPHLHAKHIHRLFETKVLHDMRMVQISQRVALRLERVDDDDLPPIRTVAVRLGKLDLLDRDHLARRSIESEIYAAICATSDELAAHPLESRYDHSQG